MAKFKKGESGNPKGRPRGASEASKLRRAIAGDVPDIIAAMVKQAKEGDTAAAKMLLDRVCPALKAQAQSVQVPGMDADSVTERAKAALDAAGRGELAPDTAATLVSAVAGLARVVEIDELVKRVEALEHGHESA